MKNSASIENFPLNCTSEPTTETSTENFSKDEYELMCGGVRRVDCMYDTILISTVTRKCFGQEVSATIYLTEEVLNKMLRIIKQNKVDKQ
jgi:hypothetical protein